MSPAALTLAVLDGHVLFTVLDLAGTFAFALSGAVAARERGLDWFGVLVLAFGWNRADPVISIGIGVLVLWGGVRLVREMSHVLMEGSPVALDLDHLEEALRSVDGVLDFHDLHVWSISSGFDVLTVHVVIAPGHHGTAVVDAVTRKVRERFRIDHVTIQPEAPTTPALVPLRVVKREGTGSDPRATSSSFAARDRRLIAASRRRAAPCEAAGSTCTSSRGPRPRVYRAPLPLSCMARRALGSRAIPT